MQEPVWVEKREVLIAHSRQLAEHGGSDGIRDEGLLEPALGKPKNVFLYEDGVDLCRLAASYAFGIARNHPFVDGNKRTALVIAEGLLGFNGLRITAPKEEKYLTFLQLAEGSLAEDGLANWFRRFSVPRTSKT